MSHLTLTEVGQDLDRIVKLDSSNPTVGNGDALVAIEAAPVNNADVLFAAGWFGVYPNVPSPWAPKVSAGSCRSAPMSTRRWSGDASWSCRPSRSAPGRRRRSCPRAG